MPNVFVVGWPAWMALLVALAFWVGFLWLMTRLFRTRERVICPVEHRAARVTFVRGPDGAKDDVVRCTLLANPRVVTCSKACLATARP